MYAISAMGLKRAEQRALVRLCYNDGVIIINATITRDDPTCKLLNPPSFPLYSRPRVRIIVGFGHSVCVRVWESTVGEIVVTKEPGGNIGEEGRKGNAPFSIIDTTGVYNWYSDAREFAPLSTPSMISTVFGRVPLRGRLNRTMRLSCVSDGLCCTHAR